MHYYNSEDMLRVYELIKSVNHFDLTPDDRKDTEISKRFVFKELTKTDEIMQVFALRYLVYRYVNFIESNKHQIDIDCYDLYSSFLGAYEVYGNTKRLIGTVRIISGDKKSPYSDLIIDVVERMNNGLKSVILDRPKLFPIMLTFKIPDLLPSSNGTNRDNQIFSSKPFEISRLALLPEYWGSKQKIESGLHELIILDAWNSIPRKNIYMIATHPNTKKRYQKLGFKIIPGTKERVYKPLKQLAVAMKVNLDEYLHTPNPYSERCTQSYNTYLDKGYIIKTG